MSNLVLSRYVKGLNALFLANQIARNAIDFKMNIIKSIGLSTNRKKQMYLQLKHQVQCRQRKHQLLPVNLEKDKSILIIA